MARKGQGVAVAFALAMLASSPADAATYVYDLTAPTGSSNVGSNGGSYTYSLGSGANSLNLRASAWSIDTTKATPLVQNAILNIFSGKGLGVDNRIEPSGSPQHSVDNSGGIVDFVMLQFDRKVDLNSINFGWYSGDADATILWGSMGVAWNTSPALNNTGVSTLTSKIVGQENSDVSSNYLGWRGVNTANVMADTWIISARTVANSGTDYFKIKGLSVDAPAAVPEPATWMAMLVGFGAIGVAQRRRRSAPNVRMKIGQA